MTNDIEAAARAWVASEVDAYPGASMDDRIASWMRGGVYPDDVGRFLVDAYSSGYCAALAHAARGITTPTATGEGFAGLPVAYQSSSIGAPPWAGPATREADPDPRGEDREAVEAARGEDVGERQRFLAWWHGHDATDYFAFPEETTKCVAYSAWCGRARALRTAEQGEGGR